MRSAAWPDEKSALMFEKDCGFDFGCFVRIFENTFSMIKEHLKLVENNQNAKWAYKHVFCNHMIRDRNR